VIGTVGERRVVQGAIRFRDHHGLGAHLHHESLRDGQDGCRGGDAEAAVREPVQVQGEPRESHGGVHGQANPPGAAHGFEHIRAVAPRGVHHELTGLPRARGTEPAHQAW